MVAMTTSYPLRAPCDDGFLPSHHFDDASGRPANFGAVSAAMTRVRRLTDERTR